MRENGKGKQHIWRKARDALRLKLGDIQPTRLAARSIPYLIIFYLVDKEAWLYRHCIGGSAFDRVLAVLMNSEFSSH